VSASDLVTITRSAFTYPIFAQIVSTANAEVAGRALTNTNEMLGVYPGADGVKTGTTDNAGECLVASTTRNGHRLLAVVLGSKDRYADGMAMLDFAEAGWAWQRLSLSDDALAWETGQDGRLHRLSSPDPADVFLARWQSPLARPVRVLDPAVSLTGTLPVGELRLVLPDRIAARTPLTVLHGP
jgi:D-alanyl-D-alanine carboxypeptidase